MREPGELRTTRLPASRVTQARTRLNRILIGATMIRERQITMLRKGQTPAIVAQILGDGPDRPPPRALDLDGARASRARLNRLRKAARTLPANHPLLVALDRAPVTTAAFGLGMNARHTLHDDLGDDHPDIALLKFAEAIESEIASDVSSHKAPSPEGSLDAQAMAAMARRVAAQPYGDS